MTPLGLQSKGVIFTNMFITRPSSRSPISNLFAEVGVGYWHSVELAAGAPWYLVKFRQVQRDDAGEFELNRTMLLTSLEAVEHIAGEGSVGTLRLDSVHVVTPSHLNGSNSWKMELLQAVWMAQEPNAPGQLAEIYEIHGGAKYVYSMMETSIDDLERKTVRFKAPRQPVQDGLQVKASLEP